MRSDDGSNTALFAVVALASAACVVSGCTEVDGGAAELSWKLRPASSGLEDKFVQCDSGKPGTGPITRMRLVWEVGEETDFEEWPCGDSYGVTGFALPEGLALFSVVPICESGPADPASYIAPAVERRNVILGNTVSLGAIELVVQVSTCDTQVCICR